MGYAVGFHVLSGNDNGTFAYHGRPEAATCSACNGVLAKEKAPLAGVRIRRRQYDVSYTYDGACIVTERFKEVCRAGGLTGAVFRPLPDDPGHYVLWSDVVVEFDPETAGAQFLERCHACGRHRGIHVSKACLKPGSVVPDMGLARTDLWFAGLSGYDERHPLLLCGDGAAKALREANLRGLEFTSEEPPVTIPEELWSRALPTLRKAARKATARAAMQWDGEAWRKARARGKPELSPPCVSLRLRSGAVIEDVEVNWDREITCTGVTADPDHAPARGFYVEVDQEPVGYETEDIVAIGIPLRGLLGLRRRLVWCEGSG